MASQFAQDFSAKALQNTQLATDAKGASDRLKQTRREGLIHGDVHDSNAYSLGGVSGNAGLFSTASDIMKMADEFMAGATGTSEPMLLTASSIRQMSRCQRSADGKRRGLGWQLSGGKSSSCGSRISQNAFGHTGFTGCSLWLDPKRQLTVAILSNAVCPRYKPEAMSGFRPKFHDLAISLSDHTFKQAKA